jgi:HAD superfamily hydrolase (TIGR01549 family)
MRFVIFDIDDVLVDKWTSTPRTGVSHTIRDMAAQGARFAIATNQAGVSWRDATGDPKFPSAAGVGRRIAALAKELPELEAAWWFVSIGGDSRLSIAPERYRVLSAGVSRAARHLKVRTSSDPAWRKPNPGMLLAACAAMGCSPEDAVFIGDLGTDQEAAEAAGIMFCTPEELFKE